jgi:hypothetical protein
MLSNYFIQNLCSENNITYKRNEYKKEIKIKTESDDNQKIHVLTLKSTGIKLGRKKSSANTTSNSALSSSEAMS